MRPTPVAEAIATWGASLTLDAIPDAVQQRLRLLILDHVSVTVGGIGHRAVRPTLDFIAARGEPAAQDRHPGPVVIWGVGRQAALEDAVLAHATAASALDFDDVHLGAGIHPGASCLPAILGLAEQRQSPLGDTIVAAAVAYEAMVRIGMAMFPASRARGFHATPVIGSIGAALGAARMMGLTTAQLASAASLAAMNAGGLFAYDGNWIDPSRVQVGRIAREGLLCAQLAAAGSAAPGDVFESPSGYLQAFGGSTDRAGITEGLGADWHLMRTEPKLYPFCKQTYGAIEAALALRNGGLRTADIASVRIGATASAAALPLEYPGTADDALLSVRFAVASSLANGHPTLAHLDAEALRDAETAGLFHRTAVTEDPECTRKFPPKTAASIVVELEDGTQLHSSADGDEALNNPAFELEALTAKFFELVVPRIGAHRCDELLSAGLTATDDTFAKLLGTL
ncbi:2-methylcitrate dehydratase PrpD [Arthrobacter ginsengisoli]|uniref:2-methylcitrate dehydratase PrpD n=1 Tax=Arthrobacter ginsengisoli TaxID=1356565 RepID=A0ABU1UDZ4_9MICC|nr:MmgE/PrpD family protein [Arthrobacter ginsengisoli]MDR7083401.1 2-methylcitrate dehydratase PrpD [Arthrobacter ginsengisoli]